jgi:hypothetical protein
MEMRLIRSDSTIARAKFPECGGPMITVQQNEILIIATDGQRVDWNLISGGVTHDVATLSRQRREL